MITTTRSERNNSVLYGNEKVNVAILEKEMPNSYSEFTSNKVETTEDYQQARERMQRNLEKLLNYDRYNEVVETCNEEDTANRCVVNEDSNDIMPTSTTMQFGDSDADAIFDDLNKKFDNNESEDASFKLNKRGKIAIALYSICVAIVMALIIFNTGIIAVLSNQQQSKIEQMQQARYTLNEKRLMSSDKIEEVDNQLFELRDSN